MSKVLAQGIMTGNPESGRYFGNRMLPLGHLFDGFNLELFFVTLLLAHDTS